MHAKLLEPKNGIPYTTITPLIFIFVRACVHYAMFENEYYLKAQMEVLKQEYIRCQAPLKFYKLNDKVKYKNHW